MEKQLLLIANAHMHWDPEYSDVKLVQTMMFLSEVKNIVDKATRSLKLSSVSGETNAIPLVLCADLNSLPDSGKLAWLNGTNAHLSPPPYLHWCFENVGFSTLCSYILCIVLFQDWLLIDYAIVRKLFSFGYCLKF